MNDKIIDLHIHSNFSDGAYSPEEIVREAKDRQLDLIALTDHNTFSGIESFKKYCLEYNQKALAGIELSTNYYNKEIHLIGYFSLDTDFNSKNFDDLNNIIFSYKDNKKIQLETIINNLKLDGINISLSHFYSTMEEITGCNNFNRTHICEYLIKMGIISTIQEGFEKYVGKDTSYFAENKTVLLKDGINAIKKAGGLTCIAHPGLYDFKKSDLNSFLFFCLCNKVDGIELFHPDNSIKFINELFPFILGMQIYDDNTFPFFLSAGSDFHGNKKINKLGEPFLEKQIEDDILKLYYFSSFLTYCKLKEIICI